MPKVGPLLENKRLYCNAMYKQRTILFQKGDNDFFQPLCWYNNIALLKLVYCRKCFFHVSNLALGCRIDHNLEIMVSLLLFRLTVPQVKKHAKSLELVDILHWKFSEQENFLKNMVAQEKQVVLKMIFILRYISHWRDCIIKCKRRLINKYEAS